MCVHKIKEDADKHAPIKQASLTKIKHISKPWITKSLLTSIIIKQKMYKTHFLSKELNKIKKYKQYSKLLNRMKNGANTWHYNHHFQLHKNCLKEIWKLIGT